MQPTPEWMLKKGEVLTERTTDVLAVDQAPVHTPEAVSPTAGAPQITNHTSVRSVSTSKRKKVAERGSTLPPRGSRSVNSPDEARKAVARSGGCDAYAPARTKCKICGKVHPL